MCGLNRVPEPIKWLTDNGICYTSRNTRAFAVADNADLRDAEVRGSVSRAFSRLDYGGGMPITDPDNRAELIETIHQPWKATLGECLRRWNGLDPLRRTQSYLVIEKNSGNRLTLNAAMIAIMAERLVA
ncbi:hypothetical protein QP185_20750 [Sphingomonas aerolata]|uniref:hypothetical protein n=1 Tax=Sphingomonas aerolata TaxID=185951 RepID=UPI002FE076BC